MYRALTVFDLDDTLLNADKQIAPANLAALTALRANHVLPAIATGRDRFEIQDVMQTGSFDTIVSANGADVFARGQQLFENPIHPTTLQHLRDWTTRHHVSLALSNHDGIRLNHADDLVATNYQRIHRPLPPIDAALTTSAPISKALVFLADHGRGAELEADLRATFSDLTFYRNSDVCIDIVPAGTTKASGIQVLQQDAELKGVPVYTFGDGHNDVPMLKAATVGIAMGNAATDVQAQADYVTDRFDANGIVHALQHFNLIN